MEVKMKKGKQWDKPQIGVVSLGKSGKSSGSYRQREDLYCVGPTPPAPADIGAYRKREDQYCVGPTPPDFELKL